MGRIFIEAKPVEIFSVETSYDHLYLVYEDSTGEEFVIRGGPEGDVVGLLGSLKVELGVPIVSSEDARGEETSSDRGQVELNLDGRSPEEVWLQMIQMAQSIHSAKVEYTTHVGGGPDGEWQNSNSVIASILHSVGVDVDRYLPLSLKDGLSNTPGDQNLLTEVPRQIVGSSSNDQIYGGTGSDHLVGADGNDYISSQGGGSFINGGAGNDVIFTFGSADVIHGGDGNDYINCNQPQSTSVTLNNTVSYKHSIENYTISALDGDTFLISALVGSEGSDRVVGASHFQFGANSEAITSNDLETFVIAISSVAHNSTHIEQYATDGLQIGEHLGMVLQSQDFADAFEFSSFDEGIGMTALSPNAPIFAMAEISYSNGILYGVGAASGSVVSGSVWDEDLEGTEEADTIDLGNGNDRYEAGEGNDLVYGGAGVDRIEGGNGSDVIYGGDDNDDIRANTITGTGDQNTINFLYGEAGDDRLRGAEGDDYLHGGDDNDRITGELGNDSLIGADGNDTLFGQSGNDLIFGGDGRDYLDGGDGSDLLDGGQGEDRYYAGAGDDILVIHQDGQDERDIFGGDGADIFRFGAALEGEHLDGDWIQDFSVSDGDQIDLTALDIERTDLVITSSSGRFFTITSIHFTSVIKISSSENMTSEQLLNSLIGLQYSGKFTEESDRVELSSSGTYYAYGGYDKVTGTSGIEIIYGGSGGDFLLGEGGDDELYGGLDNDTLFGGSGADLLDGGSGFDHAYYYHSDDRVIVNLETGTGSQGHAEGDVLVSIEEVTGSAFDDEITGDDSINHLRGLHGDDNLSGGNGNDYLSGGAGDDELNGGSGDDLLCGGEGDDLMFGGAGADTFDGGAGIDTVKYTDSATGLFVSLNDASQNTGDAAGDTYVEVENLIGSFKADVLEGDDQDNAMWGHYHNDVLHGLGGDDRLSGDNGNDTLIGGLGADFLYGGWGNDSASYEDAETGLVASLENPDLNTGEAAGDTYLSIENLIGSDHNDRLYGTSQSDNVINGGNGNDYIDGKAGTNILSGGDGKDTFAISSLDSFNTVQDFNTRDDTIDLREALSNFQSIGVNFFGEQPLKCLARAGSGYDAVVTIRQVSDDVQVYIETASSNAKLGEDANSALSFVLEDTNINFLDSSDFMIF